MPSEHVESLLKRVAAEPVRAEGTKFAHVKIHNYWNAVVVTPHQHTRLVTLMRARIPSANARAKEFYDAWKAAMDAKKPTPPPPGSLF